MLVKSPIVDSRGQPFRRTVRAKYDAAQTSRENIRHWAMADSMSPDAANSVAVRQKLRTRARYEYLNNAYCRGMVETLSADVIGTGPRLQVTTGAGKDVDQLIERRFAAWARAVHFARKLRTLRRARCVDGEGIALLTTKRRPGTPITLNVRPVEAERMATPDIVFRDDQIDGVVLDSEGEPAAYHVLREHPGDDTYTGTAVDEYDVIPVGALVHLYRHDRAEQHRGIPEITPALHLFALLRRYTLATVVTAEIAAEISAVLKTSHPELSGYEFDESGDTANEPSTYTTFDVFDIERGAILTLPAETELQQLKPEHPPQRYTEFKREILAEAFASVVMPYGVGANDSSDYNFASGKLDRMTYARVVGIDRADIAIEALQLVFGSWWLEAKLVWPEFAKLKPLAEWALQWFWDGCEDIDPAKGAQQRASDLQWGADTLPAIYDAKGLDYEVEQTKQAAALGLSLDEYRERLADKILGPEMTNAEQEGPPQGAAPPKARQSAGKREG